MALGATRRLSLLRRNRGFALLFWATAGSAVGTYFAALALSVDILDRTDSGRWLAALLIADFLPIVVIGVTLGPLVDRLSRRRLMIVSDLVRAGTFAALPFVDDPAAIVALAGVNGIATGFFRPAVWAGMPNLVAEDEREQATSLLTTVEHIAWTLGPILAGGLLAASGPDIAYWANAGTFVLSALIVSRIPARALRSDAPITRGHWADLRDGLAVVFHSRHLVTVLVVWTTAGVATAFVNVAEVPFAKNEIGAGNLGLGFLVASTGVGLIFGSFFAASALGSARDDTGVRRRTARDGRRLRHRLGVADDRRRRGARGRRDGGQRRRDRLQPGTRATRRAGRDARPCARGADVELLRRPRSLDGGRAACSSTPPARGRPGRSPGASTSSLRCSRSCSRPGRGTSHGAAGAHERRAAGFERLRALMTEVEETRRREQNGTGGRGRSGSRAATRRRGPVRSVESRRWHAPNGRRTRSSPASSPATAARSHARSRSSRTARRSARRSSAASTPRRAAQRRSGVTGPPGVGKSSLVSALVTHVRARGRTVGVVSVDPSSPFTRGALLGDRIRLADHFLDPGVYIRSMGTRGHLGGLAEATLQALLLVDASGKEVVFLETVGTGQSEVEVIGIADLVLLVLMPGSGDAVQALKAGIMEIPDVIAVNKMDHPAAKTMVQEVRSIVALDPDRERRPPILLTEALRGEGIAELWEALEKRRRDLEERGELAARRERNLSGEVEALAVARIRERVRRTIAEDPEVRELVAGVQRREVDPLTAVGAAVAAVTERSG